MVKNLEEKYTQWQKDCKEKLKTFEVLSDFNGMTKNMTFKCLICGHVFTSTPYEFKRKKTRGCKICDNNKRRRNEDEFLESVKEKNKHFDDIVIGEYKSKREKIEVTCKLCGSKNYYLPISLESGCWCSKCKGSRLKTREAFIEDLYKVHGNLVSLVGDYEDDSTKTIFKCNKCGNEWKQKPRVLLNGHGCPKCKMKHLERDVQEAFKYHNVIFQKQFDWLKNRGKMFLDFYLPDKNIAIECQGGQHFFPVDFGGKGIVWAQENFEELLKRDFLKKKLCQEHGIKILYYTLERWTKTIDLFDEEFLNIYDGESVFTNIDKLKETIYGK